MKPNKDYTTYPYKIDRKLEELHLICRAEVIGQLSRRVRLQVKICWDLVYSRNKLTKITSGMLLTPPICITGCLKVIIVIVIVNIALFKRNVLNLSDIFYRDEYLTILSKSNVYTQNDKQFLSLIFTFQFKSMKQITPAIRYKNCQ